MEKMSTYEEYMVFKTYYDLISNEWKKEVEDIDDKHKVNASIWLENTNKQNQNESKELLLEIVKKVYSRLVCPRLIGITPIIPPVDHLFYKICNKNGSFLKRDESEVQIDSFHSKSFFSKKAVEDLKVIHDIDAKEEVSCIVAGEMANEIDRKIISTLLKVPRTNVYYDCLPGRTIRDQSRSLFVIIDDVCDQIENFTGYRPNWIIMPPEAMLLISVARNLINFAPNEENTSLRYCGEIEEINLSVYKDSFLPGCKILLGFYEPPLKSGLFYCPHSIIASETKDKISFTRLESINLVPNGENFYGMITIEELF